MCPFPEKSQDITPINLKEVTPIESIDGKPREKQKQRKEKARLNSRAKFQNKRILSRSPWDRVCVCSISVTDQALETGLLAFTVLSQGANKFS
ncbi:erythronate-4-phosphate dehydrogenase [Vibrio alginolyticus]|uniref:Erythronate-4-phosphate dehydrogenase n=1 Tax=Vibrio alginolyticus TaxID=663 RepID=A0A7Y4B2Q8_VIBAL|nr:erythronate-4-phosphate dehydrogenase [Vibrio alginolyticus]KFJ85248.1 erythronate-4-phosphate dehydrogenase [Vibrio sp. OY15]NNN40448.1 erythronate-4-phosphate dehydrogenase [Vibrio sp. 2-2(2)]NNN64810.1 erythronate-4-phosphate dehydrogenase [Vibrio sp. 2-1(7)]NNO01458.1 erythronate-4-phosphate dehydrogenase [Vibrio sp. 7-5(1-a)]